MLDTPPNAQSIAKSIAITYVNHGLTLMFAYLAQKGLRADSVLTADNIAILAAAVVAGGSSLAMAVYRKLKARRLVVAAMQAPVGATIEQVKTEAAALPLLVGK